MKKKTFLYSALGLIALLGTLNLVALEFYFYWTIWWFDNLMHFLGGFSLGFLMLYIFHESNLSKQSMSFQKSFVLGFVFVMILGVAYEVFEYVYDISQFFESYTVDTLADLFFDALGAILALSVGRRYLELT